MKALNIFTNGIVKENPLLVLSIGLCSSLAVTTSVFNGLGMGLSMTFVLLMSEIIISLFRKLIPSAIRLPIFIIVIAAFTTIVQLLLQAYVPALSDSLGVFIPLIVVNCIIMGRVEAFSSKNNTGLAILDALGMGIGYTWVLIAISLVRELLGSGKIFGYEIFAEENAIGFFSGAPGGFFVFGIMIAITLGLSEMKKNKGAKK
ncbi:MAG: electron transport complex subunit E [Treponema sp.]|nr:electron transport complex subunit E [Treponema sp.]